MKVLLSIAVFFFIIAYPHDLRGSADKKKKCNDSFLEDYRGYTFTKIGLLPLNEFKSSSKSFTFKKFLTLGINNDDNLRRKVIKSFPSLQNTAALEKYAAHEKNGSRSPFIISDYFPIITKTLSDERLRRRANCLVAALAWFGLTDDFDLFHEDFSRLLKDNFELIKPSRAGTAVPPETMVTWCGKKSDKWSAMHAAVYLGDNIVWHKLGIDQPVYSYLDDVMSSYGVHGKDSDQGVMRFFKRK